MPDKGEVNTKPSVTIPDQVESLQTILERHAQGQPLAFKPNPVYLEELQIPDFKNMDLAEVDEYRRMYQQQIDDNLKKRAVLEVLMKNRKSDEDKPNQDPKADEKADNGGV